jgi:hypothetical protein
MKIRFFSHCKNALLLTGCPPLSLLAGEWGSRRAHFPKVFTTLSDTRDFFDKENILINITKIPITPRSDTIYKS